MIVDDDLELTRAKKLINEIFTRVVDDKSDTADFIKRLIRSSRQKPYEFTEIRKTVWVVEKYVRDRNEWNQIGGEENSLSLAGVKLRSSYRTGTAWRSKFRILKLTTKAVQVPESEYETEAK